MEFKSILSRKGNLSYETSEPPFFKDLRLDSLLNIIRREVQGYSVRDFFYTFPGDPADISYRQEIFGELAAREGLVSSFREFCSLMQASREYKRLSEEARDGLRRAGYHLEAARSYYDAVTGLCEALEQEELGASGFISLREYARDCLRQMREGGFADALEKALSFYSQICFELTVDDAWITIRERDEMQEDFRDFLRELSDLLGVSDKAPVITDIYDAVNEPSDLESALIDLLKKSNPEIFREILAFYDSYPSFYPEILLTFEKEIPFYIGFYEFYKKTRKMGYDLTIPRIGDECALNGQGVYDLALAWKNGSRGEPVIANDFSYPERPAFFVVTGPNQGGKTTFARAVGQSVYLAKMGLPVNAARLETPFFTDIATHFEREESLQSNSGKLKEEIKRLVPMMNARGDGRRFIILNELFTTATTHDAFYMGKRAMDHFLQNACSGIYVTHIRELADEAARPGQVISLVAQVDEAHENRRTYRILPMKAEGEGYSDSLVEQYKLDYDSVKQRISAKKTACEGKGATL